MLNYIILHGRLVETPELKTTGSGTSVTSFRIAVPRDYKTSDGQEITDFHTCVAWRKTAEFIPRYFAKGSEIIVQGTLENRSFEDKNGNKRTVSEINVAKVEFCGSKKDKKEYNEVTTSTPAFAPAPTGFSEMPSDDDLPF